MFMMLFSATMCVLHYFSALYGNDFADVDWAVR